MPSTQRSEHADNIQSVATLRCAEVRAVEKPMPQEHARHAAAEHAQDTSRGDLCIYCPPLQHALHVLEDEELQATTSKVGNDRDEVQEDVCPVVAPSQLIALERKGLARRTSDQAIAIREVARRQLQDIAVHRAKVQASISTVQSDKHPIEVTQ